MALKTLTDFEKSFVSGMESDYDGRDIALLHLAGILSVDMDDFTLQRFIDGYRTGIYQTVLAINGKDDVQVSLFRKEITDAKKSGLEPLQQGIVAGRSLAFLVYGKGLEEKWISKISSASWKITTHLTGEIPSKTPPKRSSGKGSGKKTTPHS